MTNANTTLKITLTTLIAQRELWEDGSCKKANAELYSILEECSTIYETLRANRKNVYAFNAFAEEHGVNFNKGTSLATKIVRMVFGKQSSRELAYARVIKVGFAEKAAQQTLTNFIIEHGGVENVRRTAANKVATTLSADDYREIAEQTFTGVKALTKFDISNYMLTDVNNETEYMVALVRCDNNGVGEVVCGSNKLTLVNSALAVIGKDINTLQNTYASKTALADKRQQAAESVKLFLNNIHNDTAGDTAA